MLNKVRQLWNVCVAIARLGLAITTWVYIIMFFLRGDTTVGLKAGLCGLILLLMGQAELQDAEKRNV